MRQHPWIEISRCVMVMKRKRKPFFATVFCSENVNIVWVPHRIFYFFFFISSRGVIMQSLHPMSQEPVGWFNMKINPRQIVQLQWRLIESIINQIGFFLISLSHCWRCYKGLLWTRWASVSKYTWNLSGHTSLWSEVLYIRWSIQEWHHQLFPFKKEFP